MTMRRRTGVWGWSPSGVHGQTIAMKPPKVEYFYFSDKRYKYAENSVGLLVLHLQTPINVQPCFALILSPNICP